MRWFSKKKIVILELVRTRRSAERNIELRMIFLIARHSQNYILVFPTFCEGRKWFTTLSKVLQTLLVPAGHSLLEIFTKPTNLYKSYKTDKYRTASFSINRFDQILDKNRTAFISSKHRAILKRLNKNTRNIRTPPIENWRIFQRNMTSSPKRRWIDSGANIFESIGNRCFEFSGSLVQHFRTKLNQPTHSHCV